VISSYHPVVGSPFTFGGNRKDNAFASADSLAKVVEFFKNNLG
jgi:hypothetical protein